MNTFKIGDIVQIIDGSEAHLDTGTIYDMQYGLIYVLLDDLATIWPVYPEEIVSYDKRRI